MKATVYIATSVDGFIARKNGGIDWLPGGGDAEDEDYGYQEFIDSVDAIVMGRSTYESALSFGSWPYGEKPVVILSRRQVDIADDIARTRREKWSGVLQRVDLGIYILTVERRFKDSLVKA